MNWRPIHPRPSLIESLKRQAPHELLGISVTASEDDIKIAFRNKARIYHPDAVDPFLKPHSEEVMKLLNHAYRVMLSRVPK